MKEKVVKGLLCIIILISGVLILTGCEDIYYSSNYIEEEYEEVEEQPSPISINNFKYTVDSVGGIEWTFDITNNTERTINYIQLQWYCYNAVKDPIYDSISGRNFVNLLYTGPLEPYGNTGTKRNTTKFYNPNYSYANLSYVRITYEDGEELIIKNNNISKYIGLINN